MTLLKALLSLAVPAVLFLFALLLKRSVTVPPDWQPLLPLFPILAAGLAGVLGWRFNRTRVIWILLVLLATERALAWAPTPPLRDYVLAVAGLLVPLNLLLIGWWAERGLVTLHGALRGLLLASQVGVVAWLYQARGGELLARLERPLAPKLMVPGSLSQITLLAGLVALVGLVLHFNGRREPLEGSFPWVLAAVLAGLAWPAEFAYWGGTSLLILAVAIVEGGFSMAFHDELTGLPGRRAMNEFLLRVGRRYTVAMVDVDHFKKVNDTHGHDVGDQVLRMVATCLRRVGGGGRAFRYGGEEFSVIFPNKELDRALPHLEELREAIGRTGFTLRGRSRPKEKPRKSRGGGGGKGLLQVTVSIGVAARDERHTTPQELIKAADKALYKAKKGGRNRVCSA